MTARLAGTYKIDILSGEPNTEHSLKSAVSTFTLIVM